ncbi:hypothetical protein HRbin41_01452 [bacterium HR41]|nr:hypothetical protein HRbin41_01452 [bacterium HR41]
MGVHEVAEVALDTERDTTRHQTAGDADEPAHDRESGDRRPVELEPRAAGTDIVDGAADRVGDGNPGRERRAGQQHRGDHGGPVAVEET